MSSNNLLIEKIRFGEPLTPYQSRSKGTDFEDILQHLKLDLKAAELRHTISMVQSSNSASDLDFLSGKELDMLPDSQLLEMSPFEFSLLEEMLLTALEESKLNAALPRDKITDQHSE